MTLEQMAVFLKIPNFRFRKTWHAIMFPSTTFGPVNITWYEAGSEVTLNIITVSKLLPTVILVQKRKHRCDSAYLLQKDNSQVIKLGVLEQRLGNNGEVSTS